MRNTKGFTLIELLIVIAIIGILAAVLIPNLLQARRAAQIRAEQAYAQNVYKVVNAAIAENPDLREVPTNCNVKQGSYTVGAYSTGGPAPGTITTCTVTYNPTTQEVTVTYSGVGQGTVGAGGGTGGGGTGGGGTGGGGTGGGNNP